MRDLVIKLFQIVDGREFDRLPECFHPDIVYERPGYAPYVGLDAIDHFYRNVRILASGAHEIDSICADGTAGACWGRFVGTKRDGTSADVLYADIYRFRDQKIMFRRTHFYLPGV